MALPDKQLGGSPYADSWLRQYYESTAGGQGLMKLFEVLGILGTSEASEAVPTALPNTTGRVGVGGGPPAMMRPGAPGIAAPIPTPQRVAAGTYTQPYDVAPTPDAQPTSAENIIAGVAKLAGSPMGPSAPPSQEGVMASPSQGPGAAVTVPDAARRPGIMEVIQRIVGGGDQSASALRAPAPPGPSRMAAGQLQALIGGQNPLAQSRAINIPLLSKLLGGR